MIDRRSLHNVIMIAQRLRLHNLHDLHVERVCSKMVGKSFEVCATFGGQKLRMNQKNIVGDVVESLTFMQLKNNNISIIRSPPQTSPDFKIIAGGLGYEHKCFSNQPSFDIGNFESFVEQLCKPNGVEDKVLRTKYLIFKYNSQIDSIRLEAFHMLNVWNLVKYDGKYPISLQVRRGIWNSIRPGSVADWDNDTKTPTKFMNALLMCIEQCPNIKNKNKSIYAIQDQCAELSMTL